MLEKVNKPENASSIDPQILGKILILQSALSAIPNPESMADYLCRGLEIIPGTCFTAVRINSFVKFTNDKHNKDVFANNVCELCNKEVEGRNTSGFATTSRHHDRYFCIRVHTINNNYGCIIFEKSNGDKFEPYQPFLENLANTVALNLEIRNQANNLKQLNEELQHTKDGLDVLVQERTKELTLKTEEIKNSYNELKNVQRASLNLMEDLQGEMEVRKRAEDEIRQRNREMEIIDSLIKSTTTRLELQTILDQALEGAIALTGLEGGTLCLVNHEKKVLDLSASQNASKEMFDELSEHSIGIGECLCGKAAESGEPLILWDNASGSEYATHESVRNEGIRFHAAFPLIASEKPLGVLCVFARNEYKPTEQSLKMLKELCGTVALSIENAQLYGQAQNHVENLTREMKEREHVEKRLEQLNERLRALTAHIQSVREEEGTRIAREIHDELGQALTGLKIDLKWLEKRIPVEQKPAHDKFKSMTDLIDTTIQTVRKISSELRPGVLELGLTAAINWQAREFQSRTGIPVTVSMNVENLKLNEQQSINIFRIFQEILTNIMRHANATKVTINLKKETDNLVLEVHDNGKGIKENEIRTTKSLGLLGMRERTLLLRGSIDIRGVPQQGTSVTVKIPIR